LNVYSDRKMRATALGAAFFAAICQAASGQTYIDKSGKGGFQFLVRDP
jgi:hypothetical protein